MFEKAFGDNNFAVKFYYEKPRINADKDDVFINTHCEIILKGATKEANVVIASSNVERRQSKFVRNDARKLALTRALQRGSVKLVNGKEVPAPFFTREERAAIWLAYFSLLSKKNPDAKLATLQAEPAETTE